MDQVARDCSVEPGYFSVLVKLGFLAPSIVFDILSGRQPETLDRQRLARLRKLPISWEEERRILSAAWGSAPQRGRMRGPLPHFT